MNIFAAIGRVVLGFFQQIGARFERIDTPFDEFAGFFVVSDHDIADEDHRDRAG